MGDAGRDDVPARLADAVAAPNQLMYLGTGRDGVHLDLMADARVQEAYVGDAL